MEGCVGLGVVDSTGAGVAAGAEAAGALGVADGVASGSSTGAEVGRVEGTMGEAGVSGTGVVVLPEPGVTGVLGVPLSFMMRAAAASAATMMMA